MDYTYILGRAWTITFKNRVLWLFGLILAFFGGLEGGSSWMNNFNLLGSFMPPMPVSAIGPSQVIIDRLIATLGAIVLLLFLLWLLIGMAMRPMMVTALIAMGQQVEEGAALSFKLGWSLAWSKRTWYVFLINLLIRIPSGLLYLVTFCAAFMPLLLLVFNNNPVRVAGGFATGGALLLWFGFSTVFSLVIPPFIEIAWRYAVLHQIKPTRSLRYAYALLRRQSKDFLIALVLMFVIKLIWRVGYTFGFGIIFFGFIFMGSMGGFMLGETWSALFWSLGIILILLFSLPVLALASLFLIFSFSAWTLIFKELNLRYY